MSLLSFFHSWAVANMLTFCSSATDSCPLNTEILINFMSCCFHKKIKNSWCVFNYICDIIEYIPYTSKSILIRHQWKLNLLLTILLCLMIGRIFHRLNSDFTSFFSFSFTTHTLLVLGIIRHNYFDVNLWPWIVIPPVWVTGTRTRVVFLKAIPSLITTQLFDSDINRSS